MITIRDLARSHGVQISYYKKFLRSHGIDPATIPEAFYIYRAYDMSGQLLYIGVTKDPDRRRNEHAVKDWWTQVAEFEITEVGLDRDFAYQLEAESIRVERPIYNNATRLRRQRDDIVIREAAS